MVQDCLRFLASWLSGSHKLGFPSPQLREEGLPGFHCPNSEGKVPLSSIAPTQGGRSPGLSCQPGEEGPLWALSPQLVEEGLPWALSTLLRDEGFPPGSIALAWGGNPSTRFLREKSSPCLPPPSLARQLSVASSPPVAQLYPL